MGISVVFARGLLVELENRGLEAQELLYLSNLGRGRLLDARETLSIEEADLLVRNALMLAGDPGLGLTFGAHAPKTMLQTVGHLLLAENTLRDAITTLQRYARLLADGRCWRLVERTDTAMLRFEPTLQMGDSTRCTVDFAMALSARMARHFFPHGAGLTELYLQHAATSYAQRYQAVFRCPVSFEMPSNALVFPRAYLDRQQAHADDMLRQVMRESAERLLKERVQERNFTQQVRTLLRYERPA